MGGREIFAKTVYGEARGECQEGQEWVAWVIKNRARANKSYWGGRSIGDVCTCPGQFEVWTKYDIDDFPIREPSVYSRIKRMTDRIYDASHHEDPTGGCDHYNNPGKEGYPEWTRNCNIVRRIGNHVFYKSK